MPLKIDGFTLPAQYMRYKTLGDWYGHDRHIISTVAEMGNPKYEFLIFLHELIEARLCMARGVDEGDVTRFDILFEKEGKEGEPGDDPEAPYFKEHQFATKIEMMMCDEMGLDRNAYDRFMNEYIAKNLEG